MDLNADGYIDILSGSYSRKDGPMAGLFYVLYGAEEAAFDEATPVLGTDGELLTIDTPGPGGPALGRACTRPTAVDLDGDGNLDIVSGNFFGTFSVFWGGEEGFDPLSGTLKNSEGKDLQVALHSDPTFADWDGDGDLDLISGSSLGDVVLYYNTGTKTDPSFDKYITLVRPSPQPASDGTIQLGYDHITGPGQSTRVSVADVNGDGKLDLLIGDNALLNAPADGVTEEECRQLIGEWEKEAKAIQADVPQFDSAEARKDMTDEQSKAIKAANEKMLKHNEKRSQFIQERNTGFVWLLIQE